jgi:RNA polymerase nonessential primary-like sigma factor
MKEKDAIGLYLKEMSRYPLLTPDKEVYHAKAVQEWRHKIATLPEEIQAQLRKEEKRIFGQERLNYEYWRRTCPIQIEEELSCVFFNGVVGKRSLYHGNLRLVISIAKRYAQPGQSLEDCIQNGNIGLLLAIERFNVSLGYKFSTYAYWWIRQQITRAIGETGREIRLPVHVYEKLNKIKTAYKVLGNKLNRHPSIAEIAAHLQIDVPKLREYLMFFVKPVQFDKPPENGEGTEGSLIDVFKKPGALPDTSEEDRILNDSLKDALRPLFDTLTPDEQDVLFMRYGFGGKEEMSLQQIGTIFGRSRERVRQIEYSAIGKLRKRSNGLRDYLD